MALLGARPAIDALGCSTAWLGPAFEACEDFRTDARAEFGRCGLDGIGRDDVGLAFGDGLHGRHRRGAVAEVADVGPAVAVEARRQGLRLDRRVESALLEVELGQPSCGLRACSAEPHTGLASGPQQHDPGRFPQAGADGLPCPTAAHRRTDSTVPFKAIVEQRHRVSGRGAAARWEGVPLARRPNRRPCQRVRRPPTRGHGLSSRNTRNGPSVTSRYRPRTYASRCFACAAYTAGTTRVAGRWASVSVCWKL